MFYKTRIRPFELLLLLLLLNRRLIQNKFSRCFGSMLSNFPVISRHKLTYII